MAMLRLEIITMERKLFDDQVSMVVAPGVDGVLGILPRHAALMTALDHGELKVKQDGQDDQYFAVSGGFMEVQPDHVVVMADVAEQADEIDIERAEAARRRAEEHVALARRGETSDFSQAEAALRRSILRLKIAGRRRGRRATAQEPPKPQS